MPKSNQKEPVEISIAKNREVSCDGGKDSLGHPKVYLLIDKNNEIDCPYCGKRFVLEK